MRSATTALLLVVLGTLVLAQAGQQPSFAVVSVRRTQPGSAGGPGPFVQTTPGRFVARGSPGFYIQYAYGVQPFQIDGGPDWLGSDRFDVSATQPPDAIDFALMPVMLRAALADRFRLTLRRETRDTDGYTLVASRPRLTPAARRRAAGGGSHRLGRELYLHVDVDPDSLDPNGVSIFTALQEQLGLKLDPGRVPADFLIVERAERPSDNP